MRGSQERVPQFSGAGFNTTQPVAPSFPLAFNADQSMPSSSSSFDAAQQMPSSFASAANAGQQMHSFSSAYVAQPMALSSESTVNAGQQMPSSFASAANAGQQMPSFSSAYVAQPMALSSDSIFDANQPMALSSNSIFDAQPVTFTPSQAYIDAQRLVYSSRPAFNAAQPAPLPSQPAFDAATAQPVLSSSATGPVMAQPGLSSSAAAPVMAQPGPSSFAAAPVTAQPGPSSSATGPVMAQPGPSSFAAGPVMAQPGPSSSSAAGPVTVQPQQQPRSGKTVPPATADFRRYVQNHPHMQAIITRLDSAARKHMGQKYIDYSQGCYAVVAHRAVQTPANNLVPGPRDPATEGQRPKYWCPECRDFKFDIFRHLDTHNKDPRYRVYCRYCLNGMADDAIILPTHMMSVHTDRVIDQRDPVQESERYRTMAYTTEAKPLRRLATSAIRAFIRIDQGFLEHGLECYMSHQQPDLNTIVQINSVFGMDTVYQVDLTLLVDTISEIRAKNNNAVHWGPHGLATRAGIAAMQKEDGISYLRGVRFALTSVEEIFKNFQG